MKEKSASSKKKRITYYLVLAACLLAVAGIAVGIVFAVRANTLPDNSYIDNPVDNDEGNGNDGNDGDSGDNNDPTTPPDDDEPTINPDEGDEGGNVNTNTATDFILPITNVNMSQAYVFWHDTTLDKYCLHKGVDFAAEAGTEVLATIDGTVSEVTVRDVLYGGTVTISHANGIKTTYRYIDVKEGLSVGDTVSRGDVIGTVAAAVGAEAECGAHLHFEVYANNVMVDPDDYLNLTEK